MWEGSFREKQNPEAFILKDGEMQVGLWIKMKEIKAWRGGVEIMEEIHQASELSKVQARGLKWAKEKFFLLKRKMLRGKVEGSTLLGWYNGEFSVQRGRQVGERGRGLAKAEVWNSYCLESKGSELGVSREPHEGGSVFLAKVRCL